MIFYLRVILAIVGNPFVLAHHQLSHFRAYSVGTARLLNEATVLRERNVGVPDK